jgi:uncharacterized lipoprotein YbaY
VFATAIVIHVGGAIPASAEVGDISVGGTWVCRLTRGAGGLTLEQRVRQIEQRIADLLSLPELRRRRISVEVRPAGSGAEIIAADIVIMAVTPEDTAGTKMPTLELANQWAGRLAQGLRRALPGREVIARMYTQPGGARPEEAGLLVGITWYWRGTLMNDGGQFVPGDPTRYTLQLSPDGRVAVRADCNRGTGTYTLRGRALTVSVLALTKAACPPGSLERRFLVHLGAVAGYLFRGDDLLLGLKVDSGTMRFSRALREARLSGTVTYRQRIALPSDAVVDVQLLDVSRADAPAVVLGRQTIGPRGAQVPFAFEIMYDPGRVTADAVVVVRATITAAGRLLFTTRRQYRVITAGYPGDRVEIVVESAR